MNKFTLVLFMAAIACNTVQAADRPRQSGVYACEYVSKKRGTAGDAEIELKNGQIQRIHYGNATKGLPGRPGYSCGLDIDRSNQGLKWLDTNGTLTIELEDAARYGGNSMTVSRDARGFMLDMREIKSPVCGAGSELPDTVYVPVKGKKCKIEFGN